MYIPMAVIILLLIVWVCYSTHKYNKTYQLVDDLVRSYSEVVPYLISSYLANVNDKNKRKKAIKICAKAIRQACEETVTTKSLLSTTDILSMCGIFRRSFTMREKLTHPYYEFDNGYDKELDKIENEIAKDLEIWFNA